MRTVVNVITRVFYVLGVSLFAIVLAAVAVSTNVKEIRLEHNDGQPVLDPISALTLLYCWSESGKDDDPYGEELVTHAVFTLPGQPTTFGDVEIADQIILNERAGEVHALCP